MQGAPAFMNKISSEATEKPGTGVLRMGAGELNKKISEMSLIEVIYHFLSGSFPVY